MMKTSVILLTVALIAVTYALDDKERDEVLQAHNKLRKQVREGTLKGQPKAVHMPDLIWDNDLERTAQEFVNLCQYKYDSLEHRMPQSNAQKYNGHVSQTVYRKWSDMQESFKAVALVESLGQQHHNYDFDKKACTNDKECGHYLKMVNAGTKYVGCAKKICPAEADDIPSMIVVCNYGPGSDIQGQRPYEKA